MDQSQQAAAAALRRSHDQAFAGDTLTSALAAAGVMITARSFKYHRPRGLVSAAGHDANNMFQIGAEPNQRGDQMLARDGLQFAAVNTFGGVAKDRASAMGMLSRFLPVGFYYKTCIGRRTFPVVREADPPHERPGSHRLRRAAACATGGTCIAMWP